MPQISFGGASPEAILAGGVVVLGLVLWVSGGRLLRPAVTLTGVLLGALFGSALAAGLKLPDFHTIPAPYAGLGLGGLLGLGLALALFRVAVAGIAGVGLGVFAAAAAALCLGVNAATPAASTADANATLSHVREQISSLSMTDLDQVRQQLAGHVEQRSMPTAEVMPTSLRTVSAELQDQVLARWAALGSEPRLGMVAGASLGLILGGLMGLISPRKAGALVTALAGAALWLCASAWLADRYAPSFAQQQWVAWTLAHPPAWVVLWIMLGLCGFAAQRSGEPRPQPTPAPAPKPA